jgi:hypothetical protein
VELELEHGLGLAAVAAAPFEHLGSAAAHSRERHGLPSLRPPRLLRHTSTRGGIAMPGAEASHRAA